MSRTLQFYLDIEDYPQTRDLVDTIMNLFKDEKQILTYYSLLSDGEGESDDDNEFSVDDILNSVSFRIAFKKDKVRIRLIFDGPPLPF